MDDATIINFAGQDAVADPLTALLRRGVRELLQAAIEAGRDVLLARFAARRTSDGLSAAGIIRNAPFRQGPGRSR